MYFRVYKSLNRGAWEYFPLKVLEFSFLVIIYNMQTRASKEKVEEVTVGESHARTQLEMNCFEALSQQGGRKK